MKIGIAHAAWADGRAASLDRLTTQLKGEDALVFQSAEPEHASVWVRRLWEWAAGLDEEVVLLNDDVIVCPDFGHVCEAVSIASNRWPGPISLHCSVPEAADLARQGYHFVRSYWLTGPGYILRKGDARHLLNWLDTYPSIAAQINEDNVGIHCFYAKQQPILQCIPALVRHDVSVKSTLGYDNHALRQTQVPWDAHLFSLMEIRDVNAWFPETLDHWANIPWLQNPWMSVFQMESIRKLITKEGPGPCVICGKPPLLGANGLTFCRGCIDDMHNQVASR